MVSWGFADPGRVAAQGDRQTELVARAVIGWTVADAVGRIQARLQISDRRGAADERVGGAAVVLPG